VVEKILRHCGLWNPLAPRPPPADGDWLYDPDSDSAGPRSSAAESREPVYVDIDTFEATF
jgi:hypothetical protein